jgi:PAS domain S-box-containing protein
MDWQSIKFLIPYLLSLAISIGLGVFAFRRRVITGAFELSVVAFGQFLMTLGYVFELISPDLEWMVFWDDFQFIGMFLAPSFLLVFILKYTGQKITHPEWLHTGLAVPPLLFMLLISTDNFHGLVRPDVWIIPGEPFPALVYNFSPLVLMMFTYVYLLLFPSVVLLGIQMGSSQQLYRVQTAAILFGVLFPAVMSVPTILGITFTFHRDITPFTFAIGNMIVAWGLFRHRTFDLVPVARDELVESMQDMVVVIDGFRRVVDLNRAAAEALGLDLSEVIGQPASEIFSEWSALIEQFSPLGETNTVVSVDLRGEQRHYDLSILPLKHQRGQSLGFMILARDISERVWVEEEIKKRTEELEFLNQELEAANLLLMDLGRVKDEFVTNISHELRTPITSIRLYHDLLKCNPDKLEVYTDILQRETVRLTHLIEDLLVISRLDQQRIDYSFRSVDINSFIEEIVQDRVPMIESKGLSLHFNPVEESPVTQIDHNLMGQVLSILLTNAMNYTPPGGKVFVRTRTTHFGDEIWVGFEVQDTGPGISESDQKHIFSRFFRGEAAQRSGVPGTGLGLAIAKQIVDQHQGRIDVYSDNKGTTFQVWLPVQLEGDLELEVTK